MSAVPAHGPASWLLQLPEAALTAVLEQLEACSLANTAMSCTALSHAVPGNISTIVVCCKRLETLNSLMLRFNSQRTSLNRLESCSVDSGLSCAWGPDGFPEEQRVLGILPCPQLRQLRLQMLKLQLQLDQAAGWPGVLRHCTGLTALDLRHCLICDAPAVSAAIAALSELQDLRLENNWDTRGRYPFAAAQLPTKLTQLRLGFNAGDNAHVAQLSQMSAFVNLQHLVLSHQGVPGGLPSQLVKLTCLDMQFDSCGDTAAQFRHLSALTALQRLSIKFGDMNGEILWGYMNGQILEGNFSGIAHLVQLTSLELSAGQLDFSIASTLSWSQLTALHSLSLSDCALQPAALVPLAQLQSLSLWRVRLPWGTLQHKLLAALSHLTELTHLQCGVDALGLPLGPPAPAGAYTALTAGTDLCSLGVCISPVPPSDAELFRVGTVYPQLRRVQLESVALCQQQLQRLSSSCPAVDSLVFVMNGSMPATACLPLLQLPALTSLQVHLLASDAPPARVEDIRVGLVGVAAQLTGLRSLRLGWRSHPSRRRDRVGWFDVPKLAVLQLTNLKALETLTVTFTSPSFVLQNKAACGNPPDVWIQLLRSLLHDSTCRQALLQCSTAGAAEPAELMLAQLAATLADDLAAARPAEQ